MKKKILPLVLLTMAGLMMASCGTVTNSSSQASSSPASSVASSQVASSASSSAASSAVVSSTVSSSSAVSSAPVSTVVAIHVTSVSVQADKTELDVGEKAALTIGVLPEDATDKTYTVVSSDPTIASVSGNEVTALKAGDVKITVTSNDGAKTASVDLKIYAAAAPIITIGGEKTYTVAAGVEMTLPTVSAKDYRGVDLTSAIEIEDSFETGTLTNAGKFKGNVAGDHVISYYVVDSGNREAEEFITISVTPANAETFDTTGYSDPEAIKTYGTYKENYAKGKKSVLASSASAAYITSTSEAIAGNSLIIDANQTAGSAAKSVFLTGLTDNFLRDTAVTYQVSFKYKVLTDASSASTWSNFYFGLSWDGFDGLNNAFVGSNYVKDQVYDYTCTFPATTIPSGGNAYFFFFKLAAASEEAKLAFDSITITTKETAKVTVVTPTADQLQAEGGFTWNWGDKGNTVSNGETVLVDNIEDATLKAGIKADTTNFGVNVMKLTNADSHLFGGLTTDNMIVGKLLKVDFTYYNKNNGGFNIIMMGTSGNVTLSPTVTNVGEVYTVHVEAKILAGQYGFNIYGAGNAAFEIYVGNITAALTDAPVAPTDQTANGYKVGDSWSWDARQWGAADKTSWKCEAYDSNADAIANTAMGTAPMKFTFNACSNVTMEWFQAGGKIEVGCKYKIELNYYIVSYTDGAHLYYNVDNSAFLDAGIETTAGYHKATIEWTATKGVDFFSFYVLGSETITGSMYVGPLSVTLEALAVA
ncbi:MAG: Ig-like domain-containing protein [Bacilli bacterium]|jgi:hypothetical protein|nr:Ig-like domain-containing protein [Bacilli bacterium]